MPEFNYITKEEFSASDTAERLHISNKIPPELEKNFELFQRYCINPLISNFGEIIILSGYRNIALNEKVGGSKNSYHTKCLALDFYSTIHNRDKLFSEIIRCDTIRFTELINYPSKRFLHIAFDPDKCGRHAWIKK